MAVLHNLDAGRAGCRMGIGGDSMDWFWITGWALFTMSFLVFAVSSIANISAAKRQNAAERSIGAVVHGIIALWILEALRQMK